MGKHKPIYDPASKLTGNFRSCSGAYLLMTAYLLTADCGDYIVVTNARQVKVTGKKAEQKVYYSHSQFPGGQKKVPYARMMERKPEEVGAV